MSNLQPSKNERFFQAYGGCFMKVEPVESLKSSSMIRDVLESGGVFAVNMETGALTIYRDKFKVPAKGIQYFLYDSGRLLKELSSDFAVASVQICDYEEKAETLVFVVKENGRVLGITEYRTSGRLSTFLRSVRELLTAYPRK